MIKEITDLASSFINEQWDNLKPDTELHYLYETKNDLLSGINNSYILASYIVSEIMKWGTHENHLKPFIISEHSPLIIQIKNSQQYLFDGNIFIKHETANETIEFAAYISGHNIQTIEQMYNNWKKTK